MRRYKAFRSQITLDQRIVLVGWWLITRSMVFHAVIVGMVLIIETDPAVGQALTYDSLLYGPPAWVWGIVLVFLSSLWWVSNDGVCVTAGVLLAVWFLNFATAFFLAWYHNMEFPSTTPTGVATYVFIGWSWLCVTWIVWKDTHHVKREIKRLVEAGYVPVVEKKGP